MERMDDPIFRQAYMIVSEDQEDQLIDVTVGKCGDGCNGFPNFLKKVLFGRRPQHQCEVYLQTVPEVGHRLFLSDRLSVGRFFGVFNIFPIDVHATAQDGIDRPLIG